MTAVNLVHDPVCHMDIDPATAPARSEFEGQTYYFCSPGCKRDFDQDPAGVLDADAEYDHSEPMDHGMMAAGGPEKKAWWQFWKK